MTTDAAAEIAEVAIPATPSKPPRKAPPPVVLGDGRIPVATDERKRAFGTLFGAEYLHGFQDPVIFREVDFFSPAVQQSYKREFALISRTLFAEYIYRRRPAFNQDVLDGFSTMCANKLGAIRELLTRNLARIQAACNTQGAPIDAAYMDCQHKVVPIIHANAMQYIECLLLLDRLLQASGSAVLYGIFTADQRKEAELQARKAINAFSALVRNESGKVRKEAKRLREEAQGGGEDAEASHADALLDQAQREFDGQADDKIRATAAAQASADIKDLSANAKAAEAVSAKHDPAETTATA